MEDYIQQVLHFDVQQGTPVRVEKLVSFYTSRDRAINEPLTNAGKSCARYPDFDEALQRHTRAWDELWRSSDIYLPGNARVQQLLRLHISHILQVCSTHTTNHDAGVPARGLNGEAYRGHVFWDELYVFRYLTSRLPDITRELLMYRYRRLGEARAAAREAGYAGAMFPWQSGSDGSEETQIVHLNPLSGHWDPDLSHRQRHVNAAIFYNVWHYHQATDDLDFLRDYGAEMMLEIARFWGSIAHYDADHDRYEIHGVMGPDEFHEKYPGADESGLRNNAYTNVMVAWICEQAQVVLGLLTERRRDTLRAKIGLTDDEIAKWREMSRKMFVPFHGDGIISQFEGYDELEELDWDAYRAQARQHPAPRPDPARRGRRPRPLQARQAGRHRAAVLPLLAGGDPPAVRAPRLRLGRGERAAQHRLLRPAHVARLDAELRRARRRARADRPRALVGALPRRARVRRRRRPGRHDEGGHPPRRHGRDARPRPGRLHGRGDPRRRPLLRADAHRPARRAVVPDAGPRDADPRHARRRRADGRHHRRLQPADQGRHRRRRARARRRRALHLQARRARDRRPRRAR